MNYDQPRMLADGRGWHYTSMNDGKVHAIGYCWHHKDEPHPTEDDARRCYRDYLLNERLQLTGSSREYHRCEAKGGCEILTNKIAVLDGWPRWWLCDEHLSKFQCELLFGELAGDSIHS